MASVDVKDSYYSVPIACCDKKYLKFEWMGQFYKFTCFPNGLPAEIYKTIKTSLCYIEAVWSYIILLIISSCVTNNSFASPFFNLNRGVRQGCPLSGLLFVLGIELLNLAIQTNSNIKGIKVGDEEIKNTLDADDTTLFVKDLESVQELLEMLEKFRRCSGLELNKSKTEAMWLGSWAGRKDKPFGFRWPEVSACAVGINFTNDSSTSDKLNFEKKLEDLQRILNSWKRRKLTLLGKMNIVKSLGLSK